MKWNSVPEMSIENCLCCLSISLKWFITPVYSPLGNSKIIVALPLKMDWHDSAIKANFSNSPKVGFLFSAIM